MQLSGIMQARKKLLFAALFIAILVPIFFALALRSQLAVINPADESPLITWLQQNMTSGGFWMKETGDGTSYSLVLLANNSRIGTLLFLQSHACTVVTFILLWLTLYYKKYYLVPFTTAYALLSALIFLATMGDYNINGSAGQYCVLMLWALISVKRAASARYWSIWSLWDAILSALCAAARRNNTGHRDNHIYFV